MARMTDAELREVCNRFFDAYQDHKIEEVADVISDDFVVWMLPFDKTMEREPWLKATVPGWQSHRSRTYNDRQIETFDSGFVVRYTLNLTEHDGRKWHTRVCIVAQCRDGKITRMDEYIDPPRTKAFEERVAKEKALQAERAAAAAKGA